MKCTLHRCQEKPRKLSLSAAIKPLFAERGVVLPSQLWYHEVHGTHPRVKTPRTVAAAVVLAGRTVRILLCPGQSGSFRFHSSFVVLGEIQTNAVCAIRVKFCAGGNYHIDISRHEWPDEH
nr:hypothetical protein [Pygmaiobacter massiliensis]